MKEHWTNFLLAVLTVLVAGIFINTVLSEPPDDSVALQGYQTRTVFLAAGDPLPTTMTMPVAVIQPDADLLKVDANIQQGNADVGVGNPAYFTPTIRLRVDATGDGDVPITLDGEDVTVDSLLTGTVTIDFDAKFVDSQETNTLRTVLSEESEVHDGLMFSLDRSLDVGDDVFTYLWMHVGASPAHVAIGVWGGGQLGVSLWETPTVSGGIAILPHNLNRTSSTMPLAVISHTPTIASLGSTPLFTNTVLPGGTGNNTRIGGGARSTLEWIFSPGSDYLLGVQNVSGGTVSVTMELDWNEE